MVKTYEIESESYHAKIHVELLLIGNIQLQVQLFSGSQLVWNFDNRRSNSIHHQLTVNKYI